jgi:hypothetical protein
MTNGIQGSNHAPIIYQGKTAKLLPQDGIRFNNGNRVTMVPTVAAAELLVGETNMVIYVQETQSLYQYCSVCSITRDGSLTLNTGNGGNTRWEQLYRPSYSEGQTGWIDIDSMTLSSTSSTNVRLTVPTVSIYAIKGIRYQLAAGVYDVTISGAAGPKFIGINSSGVLYHQDSLWNFDTQCPVSITYWTGTAIEAAPQTEFHGLRSSTWHEYTHQYVGLQYKSGMTFTGSVQNDNTTNPADSTVQYLWSTTGIVQDEDVRSTPGSGQWLQTLGSGLTSTTAAIFNFFYFNGTSIATVSAMSDRTPFIHAGGNTLPQWNNAGTLTAATSNTYVVYHYFATPMTGGWAIFSRPHNAIFANLPSAQLARPSELTWTNYAELKHIYTAVFRCHNNYTNSVHRAKLVSLQDFRTVAGGPVAATSATDHNALSNRAAVNSHPASAIFGTNDGGVQFHTSATGGLLSDANFIWDNTNKRLGIGTATPRTTIDVLSSGTSNISGDVSNSGIIVGANVTVSDTKCNLGVFTNDDVGADLGGAVGLGYRYLTGNATGILGAVIKTGKTTADGTGANYGGYLALCTRQDAGLMSEKIRITSSGELLINHTNIPIYDNNTDADISSYLAYKASANIKGTSAAYGTFASSSPARAGSGFYVTNTSGKDIVFASVDGIAGSATAGSETGNIIFRTMDAGATRTEKLRITNSGLVGIGTSAPDAMLTLNNAGSATMSYKTGGTTVALHGAVGGAGDGVTGSAVGDFFTRVNAKDILLSTDNGASKALAVTSSANVVSKGNFVIATRTVTATGNMVITDSVVLLNHATVAITLTLLAAAGENRGPITIKRIGAAACTIDANASETIDGALTKALDNLYSSVTIVSNGSNWFII